MSEMNIFQRMLAIENELGTVSKNLKVLDYKAVSERDIIDAVKPLENKYGVYSYPVSRTVVDAGTMELQTQKGPKTNLYMRIQTTYRFVNVDKPEEFIEVDTYGDGLDTADKSVGKAMTYADKYALMKAYKISTGDDPDAIHSSEYGEVVSKNQTTSKNTITEPQMKYIRSLYTEDQIRVMCERKGRAGLEEFSKEEAKKMIDARAPKK